METIREFTHAEKRNIWEGSSDRHIAESMSKMQKFFEFQKYGDKPLDSFKPRQIHVFFNFLEDDLGLSLSTVNRYAAALSSVFKHGVKEELISHAPDFNWKKVKSERPRYFTDKEIENLYWFFNNSGETWVADIFTVGLNTGMRLGEILQAGDTAFISPSKKFLHLPKTKNGDARDVPLNRKALEALQRLGRVKDVYNHHKFYDLWHEARDRFAKGDPNFVFHICRHTCASRMANEHKVNTLIIGKILGHRSQATTAKYVHENKDALLDIVENLAL